MSLCIEKRGNITNQTYLTPERVELSFDLPLAEIVFDFYDRLKTISKGYASFDYSPIGMRESKLGSCRYSLKRSTRRRFICARSL
jgi:GTP-binding protein LepA